MTLKMTLDLKVHNNSIVIILYAVNMNVAKLWLKLTRFCFHGNRLHKQAENKNKQKNVLDASQSKALVKLQWQSHSRGTWHMYKQKYYWDKNGKYVFVNWIADMYLWAEWQIDICQRNGRWVFVSGIAMYKVTITSKFSRKQLIIFLDIHRTHGHKTFE